MYKKAFELSYKNKKVEIEIQDFVGDVRNINGTEDLFSLSYISDSKDKGQSILVTEADINFYADDYFNIDELKTVGETDIKVKYYEDGALLWSGFVIPDFFSTSVDIAPVVSMVATDRVGTLKEISNNAESNIPIQILASCLKQTGQDLPINLIIDNNHFETPIQLERIDEIASYDVIRTFMVLFNCKITLYKNAWWIINKKLLESGFINYKSYNSNGVGGSVTPFAQPILDIDLVDRDGQREIKPTASEISLFLEFGGSKKYPSNWDFNEWSSNKLNNWTAYNGFIQNKNSKIPLSYDSNYSLIYGQDTNINSLLSRNPFFSTLTNNNYINSPHIRSEEVSMQFIKGVSEVSFKIDFSSINDDRFAIYAVLLIKTPNRNPLYHDYVAIGHDGNIVKAGTTNIDLTKVPVMRIQPAFDENQDRLTAIRTTIESKFKISASDDLDLARSSNAKIQIILFGTEYNDGANTSLIDVVLHSSEISFNDFETTGKGLIFKIKQGGEKFSKSRDPETILFSDKINQGVNGHFYNYKYDDTSIVDLPSEFALSSVRERADMFSKARDYYSLDGDFVVNPLAKYTCGLKSFVLIGGQNRREDAGIIVEEIVSNTLNRTDFIYTYFDDGKDKVKTIGTASGGSSSGGGGGSSPSVPQLIKVDEEGNYYSEQPFYSLGGLSAFGFSEVGDGNGGGGIINVIDSLTSTSKTDPLSANQGRYLKTLIDNIQVGEGGQVLVDWEAITGKPDTFAPSAHTHVIGDVEGLQSALDDKASLSQLDDKEDKFTKNTAFNKNFGTGLNDVARGNHTHTFESLTSIPTTLAGYGITDGASKVHTHAISDVTDLQTTLSNKLETTVFTTHNNDNVRHITGAERTKWNGVVTDFGNLEIGGRNYVRKSILTSLDGYLSSQISYEWVDFEEASNTTSIRIKGSAGSSRIVGWVSLPSLSLNDGDIVSAKYTLKNNATTPINISTRLKAEFIDFTLQPGEDYYFKDEGFSLIKNRIQFILQDIGDELDVLLGGFIINKGTKATDWTPAPEDQVSDWATTDVDSFSFIKNKPTMLSQFIDNIGVATHIANTSNPHSVTKGQVGLSNVDNIQQATKVEFMTQKALFDTMFRKTTTNEIEAKLSLYTLGGLSAYGFSDEGSSGGGGGIVNILSDWAIYDASKSGWALGAGLGKGLYDNKADKTDPRFTDARTPLSHSHVISDITGLQGALNSKTNQTFSDGLNTRLTSIEGGSATTVNVSGTGDLLASVSKDGNNINFIKGNQSWGNLTGKPSTFAPSAHTHPISDITNLQTTLNSKLETSIFNTHNNDNIRHITGAERTNWNTAYGWGDFREFGLGLSGSNYLSDASNIQGSGLYSLSGNALNRPGFIPSNYGSALISVYENSARIFQISGGGGDTNRMAFRHVSGTNQGTWNEIYHTGNLTSLSQLTDNIGVATHIDNTSNPHNVTKAQVGLEYADNTSDLNKPISNATQTALNLKANLASPTFTGVVTAPTFSGNLKIGDWSLLTNIYGDDFIIEYGNVTKMNFSTRGSGFVEFVGDLFTEENITAGGSISSENDVRAYELIAYDTVATPQLELGSNWKVLKTGNELEFQYNNVKKATLTPNGDLIVTGGMTAYQ